MAKTHGIGVLIEEVDGAPAGYATKIKVSNGTLSLTGETATLTTGGGGGGENPLTFVSGLTRTVDTIASDLITGKAGGQTIIGGTGASENLTITSTSNATKGNVILGSASGVVFNGVNNRLGVGTTTPVSKLDVAGTDAGPILTLTRIDTTITAGDSIGKIQFYAKDDSTTSNFIVADIECVANNTITTDINPGYLILRTTPATVAANPTERLRITHTGLVGIATSSPVGTLDVSSGLLSIIMGADVSTTTRTDATNKYARFGGVHYTNAEEPVAITNTVSSSTQNLLQFGGGAANMNTATDILFFTAADTVTLSGTERMRITSAGFVGIGTTAPSSDVEIARGAGYTQQQVSAYSSNTAHFPLIKFLKSNTNTIGSLSVTQNGNVLGAVRFMGVNSSSANSISSSIQVNQTGAAGATYIPSAMVFSTSDGVLVSTERMRIDNAGNVGIGTTPNANAILDIASTTKAFMPPRMTTAQRDAIASPTEGMVIFNTTTHVLNFYYTSWAAV